MCPTIPRKEYSPFSKFFFLTIFVASFLEWIDLSEIMWDTVKQKRGKDIGDYIHVRLPFALKHRVNALAAQRCRSLAGIVTETLLNYLSLNEPQELRDQAIAYAKELAAIQAEKAKKRNGKVKPLSPDKITVTTTPPQ